MATLTETERRQLREAAVARVPTARGQAQSVARYLSFLKFARRFAPASPGLRMVGGNLWKL